MLMVTVVFHILSDGRVGLQNKGEAVSVRQTDSCVNRAQRRERGSHAQTEGGYKSTGNLPHLWRRSGMTQSSHSVADKHLQGQATLVESRPSCSTQKWCHWQGWGQVTMELTRTLVCPCGATQPTKEAGYQFGKGHVPQEMIPGVETYSQQPSEPAPSCHCQRKNRHSPPCPA